MQRGRGRGGRGGKGHDDPNVKVSKNLSYLLRHGAEKEGLKMRNDGYVLLDDILAMDFYKKNKVDYDKVKEVVQTNDKQRFELKEEVDAQNKKIVLIRATQGHSIEKINEEELLTKITDFSGIPNCIHGTTKEAWALIKSSGLNKMKRNHVHMAIGYPGDNQVISGMRGSCDVYIEIDTQKATQAGIQFLLSKNKVVLSSGINGVIPPTYFKKVLIKKAGVMQEVNPSEYQTSNNGQMIDESKEEAKIDAQSSTSSVKQDFDYLCILDFEAQCDKDSKLDVQEIIEFPIVLVDTKKMEVVDKFHTYVKPVVHPKLYNFCTELTGITQDKVDNGISLQETLKRVEKFLTEKQVINKKFVMVTCGDWDLSICLRQEALAKKIEVPAFLTQWVNIKKLFPTDDQYKKEYKKTLPGMVKMLNLANLELLGRHHSGIDDSINIARIAIWMMKQRGINFSVKNVSHAKY